MSLSPPRLPSEPLNHPPGAPREPDIAGCTVCLASGEETIRREQAQDFLDPPGHVQGGLRGTEPPRTSTPSFQEDPDGNKHHEALQADLRGAAERVDALLTFGEGLAQRSEPRAWASLEQILRALGAHRDTIFRRLWQLQAQLASYSLVFEKANMPDQDLEVEGDLDGPGPDGASGPWAPSNLPTPAELEWDPAGDVGELGPSKQKTTQTPGPLCELCGHRGLQGRGQSLE
uniref:Spectrin repeat containing nuclear envelope family member 4 n=1 Tax=Ictidomys tridecemlineatus TaxID=43179 RepID=I3N9U3_ICTTR